MKRLFGLFAAASLVAAAVLALPPERPAAEKGDRPDVTSRGGLRIGSILVPWGNAAPVELKGSDGVPAGTQACVFNATYEMTNLGGAPTGATFTNRLRVDGATVAATSSGLALGPRETKSVATSPSLAVGSHAIELSLDDESNVAESRKDNNRFRVLYVLKAPCGGVPTLPKK
jgi:hypothetical protein